MSNRATSGRLAPGLLLAAPRLGDPNFERTVVLLGRHDDEGAMGWILNGRALGRVRDLLRVSSANEGRAAVVPRSEGFEGTARRGGPVQTESGWLLYRSADVTTALAGAIHVGSELAVTGDTQAFSALLKGDGPKDFRLILGYAGWGPGQLEGEVREGGWLPAPVDPELLWTTAPDALWDAAYRATIGVAPGAFVTSVRGQA